MSSITLYQMEQSPPARAVKMLIDLLGLDVTMKQLNPIAREQEKPPFVNMNPMRTIPILDEGDFSLADSHAIMIYLFERYSKPEHDYLYPNDQRKRARVNFILFFDCGILFPRLQDIMRPTYLGKLTEISDSMKANAGRAYKTLEVFLSGRKFVAGDILTIADLSVYTTIQTLSTLVPFDTKKCPKLSQWFKLMSGLDVVKRINEPGGTLHGKTLIEKMEKNKLTSKL